MTNSQLEKINCWELIKLDEIMSNILKDNSEGIIVNDYLYLSQ
jgi:hypothetical protein